MNTVLTITRKGQTTLPVALRRKLGIPSQGGVLHIRYHAARNELILSKAPSLEEISARATSFIRPGTKPLRDVDAYYQKHRWVRAI